MTTPPDSAPPAAAHGARLILTLGRRLAAVFAHQEGDLSDFPRKIVGYSAYGEAGGHLERFGLGNFRVLTVTTSEKRAGTLVSLAQRLTSRGLGRCLFADRETLGRYRSDVLAPPWINGRGETVTLAA